MENVRFRTNLNGFKRVLDFLHSPQNGATSNKDYYVLLKVDSVGEVNQRVSGYDITLKSSIENPPRDKVRALTDLINDIYDPLNG